METFLHLGAILIPMGFVAQSLSRHSAPVAAKGRSRQASTAKPGTVLADDLIECALLAGFLIVAAGVLMPDVILKLSTIFPHVASVLVAVG